MKDATHITMVVDRSGSMQAIRDDAEGAINAFVNEQRVVEGECTLHLYDFDAPRGMKAQTPDWFAQRYAGPIREAKRYVLDPRGNTALYDAVATAIRDTGTFLSELAEDERPDKVLFIVQTDGQENSSTEYRSEAVREMVKHQSEVYKWQFVFLGMGQDSWGGGQQLGMTNAVFAAATPHAHDHTHSVMNAYTTQYRGGHAHDMSAAANLRVDSDGRVFNAQGEELDPMTGEPLNFKA